MNNLCEFFPLTLKWNGNVKLHEKRKHLDENKYAKEKKINEDNEELIKSYEDKNMFEMEGNEMQYYKMCMCFFCINFFICFVKR